MMMNFYVDMNSSQVGEGDRAYISRIMTRLTMAKVLEMMGHNVDDFVFFKESMNSYSYYSLEELCSDLCEFLERAGADYEFEDMSLKLTFPPNTAIYDLMHSLSYDWSAIEYEEIELESITEIEENDVYSLIMFNLEEYEGTPLQFVLTYYEITKGRK